VPVAVTSSNLAAGSIARTQPQMGGAFSLKVEADLPTLQGNSESEGAPTVSEDKQGELAGTYDPNQTRVIFNPSNVSVLAKDFNADPPLLTQGEESAVTHSAVQNPIQSSALETSLLLE